MISEQVEFRLTQWVDGELSPADAATVEAMVAADPDLRRLADQHRRLAAALVHVPAMPPLDWDRLASHLSDGIERYHSSGVIGRIGRSWAVRSAVAAAAVIAVTVGLLHHQPAVVPVESTPMVVIGPKAEDPTGPAVAEVSIGPSQALAARGGAGRYADGVIARPPTALIVDRIRTDRHVH